MSKKFPIVIPVVVAVFVISSGAFAYYRSSNDKQDSPSGVLAISTNDLVTYTFKDGRTIDLRVDTSHGKIKSPLEGLVGMKGPWPENSEVIFELYGPDDKILDNTFTPPPSDASPEEEVFTDFSSTYNKKSGGKGSILLKQVTTSYGVKNTDTIAIPVEF